MAWTRSQPRTRDDTLVTYREWCKISTQFVYEIELFCRVAGADSERVVYRRGTAIIMAGMTVFYVAGYLIEERRRWPVMTASPR